MKRENVVFSLVGIRQLPWRFDEYFQVLRAQIIVQLGVWLPGSGLNLQGCFKGLTVWGRVEF